MPAQSKHSLPAHRDMHGLLPLAHDQPIRTRKAVIQAERPEQKRRMTALNPHCEFDFYAARARSAEIATIA